MALIIFVQGFCSFISEENWIPFAIYTWAKTFFTRQDVNCCFYNPCATAFCVLILKEVAFRFQFFSIILGYFEANQEACTAISVKTRCLFKSYVSSLSRNLVKWNWFFYLELFFVKYKASSYRDQYYIIIDLECIKESCFFIIRVLYQFLLF